MEQATLSKTNSYTIDNNHATVHFWVRHMMVSKVHGQIGVTSGIVTYNPEDPSQTSIQVTIDATTLSTQNEQRDGHLKSADFLDVEKYPTIAYRSTSVTKFNEIEYEITGELTIHGVTATVVLKADVTPEVKGHFGGYVVGVSATGVINRDEFGMNWNQALEAGGVLVGREIHLQIDAELARGD